MPSMEIFSIRCETNGCDAAATRRVKDSEGVVVGEFCARHGNAELIRLAKAEKPTAARATERVKAVKAGGSNA